MSEKNTSSDTNNNYDLMLLQLCFDVSEFDDYVETDDQQHQVEEDKQQQQAKKDSTGGEGSSESASSLFDPFSFVASRQQHVSLEQLEKDLQKYATHLNQSMLTCVHDEVYESFTHVAASLGNTSKRLSTVKAPLSHYLDRIKHSSSTVEKARSEIELGLQEASKAEMERRFYAARVECALLARSLNQFLSSNSARAVGSFSPGGGHSKKNASVSNAANNINNNNNQRSLSEEFSSSSSSPSPNRFNNNNNSNSNNIKALLEQLPSACQSLRRLNYLLEHDLKTCVSSISEASTTIEAQKLEIESFSNNCHVLEQSLVSLMCSAFDACYFIDENRNNGISSNEASSSPSSSSSKSNNSLHHLPEMKRLCELFSSMDRVSSFVEYFRDSIVRPLVEDIVSWRAASQARQSPDDASKLLSSLRSTLVDSGPLSLVPLLQRALTGDNNTVIKNTNSNNNSNNNLLIVACWSATADTIMKRALFLFNPGMPSHFHKHFVAANKLLVEHEIKCSNADELCVLRTSPEVSLWVRKWNVDVYHALRQKELNQSLDEEVFTKNPFFSSSDSQQQQSFRTQTVAAIFGKLKALIDPSGDIFLFSLQHRFLRDIFATIQKLISEGKSALESQASDAKNDEQKLSSVVKMWSNIRSDFSSLAQKIKSEFPSLIENGCSGSWSDAKTAQLPPVEFCSLLGEEILSSITSVDSVIKSSITGQCMANLSNVKSVKTAFSMTKKSTPTEPSTFLKGALNPLSSFYTALKNDSENPNEVRSVILDISKEILNEFGELVKDIVISSKKAQDSLEKLRRARAGGGKSENDNQQANSNNTAASKANEITDRDKIVVQLYLDISELVNIMRKFGVNAESFQPFRDLFALVKRAPWVLSNFEGEEPEEVFLSSTSAEK